MNGRQVRALAPGSGFLPFSHHPHCGKYSHHLIWLRGRPLCLGCVCMGCGAVVGLCLAAMMPWRSITLVSWILLHLVGIAPTAFQPLSRSKAYKAAARILLGISSASYLVSGLLLVDYGKSRWAWRGCVLLAFAVGYWLLTEWRNRRTDDPCESCEAGRFPTCEWNLPRLLGQNAADPVWAEVAKSRTHE